MRPNWISIRKALGKQFKQFKPCIWKLWRFNQLKFNVHIFVPTQNILLIAEKVVRTVVSATVVLKKRIDSGQSYLRLRIGSFSIEFLKKSIDSGQSYLRLRIGSFSIEFLKKSINSDKAIASTLAIAWHKKSVSSWRPSCKQKQQNAWPRALPRVKPFQS